MSSKKTTKKPPPTDDAFLQHMKRCMFQLSIWKQAIIGRQELFEPTECGWGKNESGL